MGTVTDLLICAVAARLEIPIFIVDKDFTRYAKLLYIRIHKP
jgi:predicted nucleic acid-binding protein